MSSRRYFIGPLCRTGLWLFLPAILSAQGLLNPARYPEVEKLFNQRPENPIRGCEVRPLRPQLNYGFRFVSGYMGRLPMRHYAGPGQHFRVLIRVTPDDPGGKPKVLAQFFTVPPVPPKNGANFELDGAFFVGEGGYKVDWLLADRDGRGCRKTWHIEAKMSNRDRELTVAIPAQSVSPIRYEPWKGVTKEEAARPLRLTLLLHVTPLSMRRNRMHPYDETMLLSSVLSLLQRVPFTEIKLVAFNLDQQKELFRQDGFNAQGWDNLLDAILNLQLGTVPFSVLKRPKGYVDIVRGLVNQELSAEHPSDAVIFLGPTARQSDKLRFEPASSGRTRPPFYYFEFKPYWDKSSEFPDIITHAMRSLSGKTIHIYSPHDFSSAIQQVKKVTEADLVPPAPRAMPVPDAQPR